MSYEMDKSLGYKTRPKALKAIPAGVSRQRAHQIAKFNAGICERCVRPRLPDNNLCYACMHGRRDYARARREKIREEKVLQEIGSDSSTHRTEDTITYQPTPVEDPADLGQANDDSGSTGS